MVRLLRTAVMLLKKPKSISRSELVEREKPRPPSAFQTGPVWRHVKVGMVVRLVRLMALLSVVTFPAPVPRSPCVKVGEKLPGRTRPMVNVSVRAKKST